jgi:hypothetical protein
LRRLLARELFDTYAESFERVWLSPDRPGPPGPPRDAHEHSNDPTLRRLIAPCSR